MIPFEIYYFSTTDLWDTDYISCLSLLNALSNNCMLKKAS